MEFYECPHGLMVKRITSNDEILSSILSVGKAPSYMDDKFFYDGLFEYFSYWQPSFNNHLIAQRNLLTPKLSL